MRIRVNPEGSKDPSLSEYISRARVLAGQLENQTSLSGIGYATAGAILNDRTDVTVVWNDAFKNGNPQVDATINVAPRPVERPIEIPEPPPPPPPPPPTEPPTEPPVGPPVGPQLKGAIAFFVGDETYPIYHDDAFFPSATYSADEAIFGSSVAPLIENREALVGVVNVRPSYTGGNEQDVRPIPPYVFEYIASRTTSGIGTSSVLASDYIAAINMAIPNPQAASAWGITRAYYILDDSGSMRLTSIPQSVRTHLNSLGIMDITVQSTPTERWILFMNEYFGFS